MAAEGRQMCMRLKQFLALATMVVHLVVATSYQFENSPVMTQPDCSEGGQMPFPKPVLTSDFYSHSCPEATTLISNYIQKLVKNDSSLPAAFIRLHFHDCFVRGCDASVLLHSIPGNESELEGLPNKNSLRGLHLVGQLKAELEEICPGIVSCADLITLMARDSLQAIGGPSYRVLLGRRDGLISLKAETNSLPSPFQNYSGLLQSFSSLGFDSKEMAVLSGAHSIGFSHCRFIAGRLYNFSGQVGAFDPTLDSEYAHQMRKRCPPDQNDVLFAMDPSGTQPGITFDSSYFRNLIQNRGAFTSDSTLMSTPEGQAYVIEMASPQKAVFFEAFGKAMEKMGELGVLTGAEGEIRKRCRVRNGF
ncbi:hypothetical protein Mapa_003275 [Marchantia paleacea]|nr:hypothetical protein Mapa_003275 [Marchantia paleacea]